MLGLILVSVVILIAGFAGGWKEGSVNLLLNWAYVMVGIAVCSVVVIGLIVGIKNDPKSLTKLGLGLVAAAVLCLIAYLFASGKPAIGITGMEPSAGELKLTDTILNLAYITGALAIVSIIAGEIRMALSDKKQ